MMNTVALLSLLGRFLFILGEEIFIFGACPLSDREVMYIDAYHCLRIFLFV